MFAILTKSKDGIPKNYNLNFTQMAPVNEYIFTENDRGQAVGIAGKVEHEATVGPIIDEAYHKIMQKRSKDATLNLRVSQVLDKDADKKARITKKMPTDSFLVK